MSEQTGASPESFDQTAFRKKSLVTLICFKSRFTAYLFVAGLAMVEGRGCRSYLIA